MKVGKDKAPKDTWTLLDQRRKHPQKYKAEEKYALSFPFAPLEGHYPKPDLTSEHCILCVTHSILSTRRKEQRVASRLLDFPGY